MSDQPQSTDWWLAADGKWYPPAAPPAQAAPPPAATQEVVAKDSRRLSSLSRVVLFGVAIIAVLGLWLIAYQGLHAMSNKSASYVPPSISTTTPPAPTTAQATAALAGLAPGTRSTLVAMPDGYEAATYDQSGNVAFWRYTAGSWDDLGHSTYPMLPKLHQYGVAASTNLTGMLLGGMSDATFIAEGQFTYDPSGKNVAFSNGPKGWGVVRQPTPTTLESDGRGSTDDTTPGLRYGMRFEGSMLVTVDANPYFDTQHAWPYALVTYWKGTATGFATDAYAGFTAKAASAPGPAPPLPGTCPGLPPDGTYDMKMGGFGQSNDTNVRLFVWAVEDGPQRSGCDFAVDPNLPMTVQASTNSGSTTWVTAPVWLLVTQVPSPAAQYDPYAHDEPYAPGPVTLYPTPVAQGPSPYYVPTDLGLTAIVSDLGQNDSTFEFEGVYCQITFRNGAPTALAMIDSPYLTPTTTTTAASTGLGSSMPLFPFATMREVTTWQMSSASDGRQAWHLDASQTALAFASWLGYSEINSVISVGMDSTGAHVSVGFRLARDDGSYYPPMTAAVIHLVRWGPGAEFPWEVVGTGDTILSVTSPSYGASVTSPVSVGGGITGMDESIAVEVRSLSSSSPIGKFCCLPAGGVKTPWSATVPFTAAPGEVLTISAHTGGHATEVEQFAVTGVRVN